MNKFLRVLELSALGLLLASAAAPAMARPVAVPEPDSISLLMVGVGGAYLVSKFLRRK